MLVIRLKNSIKSDGCQGEGSHRHVVADSASY